MSKMVMAQHRQIKNSHILNSCSPTNNLFSLLGFFFFLERVRGQCLSRSCFENLRGTTIKSNHNHTVSIKQRKTHLEMLKDQGILFFFSYSAKYFSEPATLWQQHSHRQCCVLTHFLTTEIWLLFSYFSLIYK